MKECMESIVQNCAIRRRSVWDPLQAGCTSYVPSATALAGLSVSQLQRRNTMTCEAANPTVCERQWERQQADRTTESGQKENTAAAAADGQVLD